ncbi:MAG: glycosyltransferase family 9 protein [Candidatus Omnitrophota bacterium]
MMDRGSLERLKSTREKNIGIMQQYAEAINQIKASDVTESAKKIAEANLIKLINGLDDDIVGPLKEEMLVEVTTLVSRSRAVGAVMAKDSSSALQNPEMGLIGSQTFGNFKFILQGQGVEGYLLKVYGKTGVAADMRFKLYNLAGGSKGIFVENVSADNKYREDFRKDFKEGIYSNILKMIVEIGGQYSRGINNVVEITGVINNLETLQGLYGAIAGRRTTGEQEEVKRLSGIEEKNYYEHTEPLIEMLKKAVIEEMNSAGEARKELEKKLPVTLLANARSGGGFSVNHRMRVDGDQIIFISNRPIQSASSSLEIRPEEAARLMREAAQENYEKWCLVGERLKTARRILVRVPGRDSRGGHEFPLGEIAATLPILIKALIMSEKDIEEIIVQCDSYPELIGALGEDRVKLAVAGQTTDELRSIYLPEMVIDFDTVALGEEIPKNTVKFPVAKLWMSPDRYGAMREILGSAKLTIPEAGEAILKREREKDGQITIFVNPHSDSNKNDNADSWVGLIQELVSKGYKVVLNSGKEASKDQAYTKNILEKLQREVESGDAKEFKGSINDLLDTLSKKIDGVVTIDSGIFHVVHSLYSLPTVVFTTSNTLGWIPQEKEELLFEKVKYSDFKYPPVVTEALQNLLEKDKRGGVGSLTKSASSPWTFEYVFEHESVKLGVDDKEQYRAILGVCLLAVAYREVGNGKWERVIAHYFPLENEETGSSKKDYIQRLFKNSEGKSMLSGNGWQVQIIPSEDMPDVLRHTFQGWSISMSDIESSLKGLNNDLSFNLLPVNQGGKTVTIYYDGLDIRDQENQITSELSFKTPLSDKTEEAKEDSVSSPVKVNIEKTKEYTIKLLKLFGYSADLFGGIKRLENDKARSQVIDGKVYFNAYWISRLADDEIERLAAHEVQHIATEELMDKNMKLGGLQEDRGYLGLMSRIGRQFDQIGEEKGDVLAKPREFYQEPWEALSLLRGYQIYLNQVARGAKTSPQPYEFIEAFTEDDLVFLDTGHLDKITKDFKAEVGTLGKITYEDLDSIGQRSDLGGIDMRSLSQHTVIQPMTGSNIPKQGSSLKVAATVLDKEWLEIERMANSGIAPSCERLREYLLSLQDPNSQIDKVLACIADILRQEEEKACCTESSLREILVLLESGRPANELKLALAKIEIFAKEPQLIEQ